MTDAESERSKAITADDPPAPDDEQFLEAEGLRLIPLEVPVELQDDAPDPPSWVSDFFTPDTRRQLLRIAWYEGARSPDEAVEAVDAALAQVVANRHRIEQPLAWARRAVRHQLPRDRQAYQRPFELAVKGEVRPEAGSDVADDIAGIDWVRRLIDSLPPKQRKAMSLFYEGLGVTEIAVVLRDTPNQVSSNLWAARQALKANAEVVSLYRPIRPDAARKRRPGSDPDV